MRPSHSSKACDIRLLGCWTNAADSRESSPSKSQAETQRMLRLTPFFQQGREGHQRRGHDDQRERDRSGRDRWRDRREGAYAMDYGPGAQQAGGEQGEAGAGRAEAHRRPQEKRELNRQGVWRDTARKAGIRTIDLLNSSSPMPQKPRPRITASMVRSGFGSAPPPEHRQGTANHGGHHHQLSQHVAEEPRLPDLPVRLARSQVTTPASANVESSGAATTAAAKKAASRRSVSNRHGVSLSRYMPPAAISASMELVTNRPESTTTASRYGVADKRGPATRRAGRWAIVAAR